MQRYEIVAFHAEREAEVDSFAREFACLYDLDVRMEQLPPVSSVVQSFLTDETVLCVFNADSIPFRRLLRFIYRIKLPVLLVRSACVAEDCMQMSIPVGYQKESKESVVWANFFQRRNPQTEIRLVVPQERDRGIAQLVDDNVQFMSRVLEKSEARFSTLPYAGTFGHTLRAAYADGRHNLTCIMKTYRLFPFYIPFNLRLYRHAPGSILIISRDDDLYVPCH